jgi:hypothetical protein
LTTISLNRYCTVPLLAHTQTSVFSRIAIMD